MSVPSSGASPRPVRPIIRCNLTDGGPATLWQLYMRLVQVEEVFKVLKGDIAARPIYHKFSLGSKPTSSSPSWRTRSTPRSGAGSGISRPG
jgi:hypothetical protein